MAGLKQLKRRLQSVKNTKKITYAMKLVAAAKLKKAQESVAGFSEYSKKLYQTAKLIEDACKAENTDSKDSDTFNADTLVIKRPVKKGVLLVFGGFRGLAGPYNINLSRELERSISNIIEKNPEAEFELIVFGKKASEFVHSKGYKVREEYNKLSDKVSEWPLQEVSTQLINEFQKEEIDSVNIVYTQFFSILKQIPSTEQILPIDMETLGNRYSNEQQQTDEAVKDPIFEPSAEELKNTIYPRLFSIQLSFAAFNSLASEHGSRMTAMDSSTKNAGELIDKLQLTYNKLRQSGITAELLDIIGGAEAVN